MLSSTRIPPANEARPRDPSPPAPAALRSRLTLRVASESDRPAIYRLRHEVYASELRQHHENRAGLLTDSLDDFNIYIVAVEDTEIQGFISITPPGGGQYSIDKYLARHELPFPFDDSLFEVRLLTVAGSARGRPVAALLMYAALRWAESHGASRLMALGRRELLDLYLKAGLRPVGRTIQSGAVTYEVLQAEPDEIGRKAALLARLGEAVHWRLDFPYLRPAPCFHGGAFFTAIGERFDALERRHQIINADVLDAWFPPSPKVLAALRAHLPWMLRTSPPTDCGGMVETIAQVRGVPNFSILPGAGSSALIYLAFQRWLTRDSRVLILDPTYGEYSHVLERVIGCRVNRFPLQPEEDYQPNLVRLAQAARAYDFIVLVNPNSPTGRLVVGAELESVLAGLPPATRVWVDETYVEYAGSEHSIERFAARSENIIVCKSMSKVYALSGARAAYLCAGRSLVEELRSITPPWAVSLPAQVAAVKALEDPAYYSARYEETRKLRAELDSRLRALGLGTTPACANFILAQLPAGGPDAATVVRRCQERGLFLRDASSMGCGLGRFALRVAVKTAPENRRIVEALSQTLSVPK